MTVLVPYGPTKVCDRCGHQLKFHAGPDRNSVCMIAGAKVWPLIALDKRPRATKCWCDGFFPRP